MVAKEGKVIGPGTDGYSIYLVAKDLLMMVCRLLLLVGPASEKEVCRSDQPTKQTHSAQDGYDCKCMPHLAGRKLRVRLRVCRSNGGLVGAGQSSQAHWGAVPNVLMKTLRASQKTP